MTVALRLIAGDGSALLVEDSGSGTPLVLLHGGLNSTRSFDRILPILTPRYRCLALGRRGYGQSGAAPGAAHSFDREAQDVATLLATLDQPAHLFGHSSGAIAAATAALAAPARVRSLVLYEPPFPIGSPHPDQWLIAAEAAVARGDNEEAALIGLRDGVGFPPPLVDRLRADPTWRERVAAAPAWIRESRSVLSLPVGVARLSAISAPTLLLTGSHTEPHHTAAIDALHGVLPDNEVAVLAGQGHTALVSAPDLLGETMLAFLDRH
ncbi:alpha/beta fold hydrolase [Pseudonocardia hispaniensis]|uniref:Alpha/beta fold hydrolase n=1 Tax=Pseudonocardia hispaniensis TaxID=904933 RepID=A0ABW1J0R8_9PSEU